METTTLTLILRKENDMEQMRYTVSYDSPETSSRMMEEYPLDDLDVAHNDIKQLIAEAYWKAFGPSALIRRP